MKHTNHNFALSVEDICARYPQRLAVIHNGQPVHYGELLHTVERVGALLAHRGVVAGDCVALWLPNTPAFLATFLASLRMGATVAPFGILLRPSEIIERLAVAQARVLVTTHALARSLTAASIPVLGVSSDLEDLPGFETASPAMAAHAQPTDIALLAFTSGTTGAPKAAEITHAGLAWNAAALAAGFALTPDDVQLAVAPLSHVLGMQGVMNATLTTGGALVLVERFDAGAVLRLMADTKATGIMGAPAMFAALVREAHATGLAPPLRFAHGGGAPFPPELARAVAATFRCVVREGYGMSEVGGGISQTPLGRSPKDFSVGEAFPGSELRIADPLSGVPCSSGARGEVQVRSPSGMRSYRGDPVGTKAVLGPDGWLATGDIGYLDDDGYLFLVGRSKEMIIRSGYNVAPREVEDVLLACPGVAEVAVLGVPDEERGEEIVALVVRSQPAWDADTIKAFAKERLAAYKYPRHILFVEELPKSPTGKLLKRNLDREAIMARLRGNASAG